MKLFKGMKMKQVRKIEEYKFDYVGTEFTITEFDENVVMARCGFGILGIKRNKLDEYFDIVDAEKYDNVKKIIRNDEATIVILEDGCKGISKCMDCDIYDEQKGFEIAKLKAEIKSKSKLLRKLCK